MAGRFTITLLISCLFMLGIRPVKAQSFGFGCLGFVGAYAGYSYQTYNPSGLNDYIYSFNQARNDSISIPLNKFGVSKGYRVGLNFFRAQIKNFILTTKGFYQSVSEDHQGVEKLSNGTRTTDMQVKINNWGVGVDLGITITDGLSWKIVDGVVNFNNVSLTDTRNAPGPETLITTYKNSSSSIGYSIGTGFIYALIEDYVSLEGTAGYTIISIDEMQQGNGVKLTVADNSTEVMNNFIKSGGFNAVVQLNLGFPL
jgi:hypothetical protein